VGNGKWEVRSRKWEMGMGLLYIGFIGGVRINPSRAQT